MKKRQIIILTGLVVIIALIAVSLATQNKAGVEKKARATRDIRYVRTKAAVIGNHAYVIRSNGRVGSSRNVMLISEVQGKLLPGQVSLKAGTSFTQGQLLCKIDDTEAGLKMQARKSNYLTMLATAIPDLKMDYPKSYSKWEKFFESIDVADDLPDLPEINGVKEKTYLASRNILGEYYNIKADEETLDKYRIRAPFDGNIVEVMIEFGSVVNPGSQIARIIQTGNLEVEMPVTVEEAALLDLGDEVMAHTSEAGHELKGRVIRIGKYVNPNTQSVDVFVALDRKSGMQIYDGMYVQLAANADTIHNAVKVPRKAIVNKHQIFTVVDSILIRRDVSVLARDAAFAYITGLETGEDVVVEALSNPVDSMVVRKIAADE